MKFAEDDLAEKIRLRIHGWIDSPLHIGSRYSSIFCLMFYLRGTDYSQTFNFEVFEFGIGTKHQCHNLKNQYFAVSIIAGACFKSAAKSKFNIS